MSSRLRVLPCSSSAVPCEHARSFCAQPIVAAIFAAAHKLMVWVDMRSSLTPGQKYVYWEKAGVHLRIEIGMKEVNAKLCKVVKSSKPEDYGSVVKVDSPLLGRALLKTLKKLSPVELDWLDVPTAPPSEEDDDDNLLINIQERIRISKLKETLITPGVAGEGSVAAELSSAGNKRTHADGVDAPPTKRRKDAAVDATDANDDDGDSSDGDSSETDAGSDSDSDSSSHTKQQKRSRKHRRGSSGEDSDTTSSGGDSSDDDSADSDDSEPAAEAENHEADTSVRPPAQGAVASDTSDSDSDSDDDDDDGSGNETSRPVSQQNPQKQRMVSGDALSDDDGFDSDTANSTSQSKIDDDAKILPAPALPEQSSSKRSSTKKSKSGRARGAVVRF